MAASPTVSQVAAPLVVTSAPPRHTLLVRVTHWVTFLAFMALLITGIELILSHPRFYWGETGNSGMTPLFSFHIPASRDTVPTGYGYTLPDQNGWSRYLHFEAAWVLVITALIYGLASVLDGHFRKDLLPAPAKSQGQAIREVLAKYLRRAPLDRDASHPYNVVQRLAYLSVIFFLFPAVIWTGLALSPAFNAAFPFFVDVLGGRQSARTLHFFITDLLVLFLIVHVAMVALSGFKSRMRAMITGRVDSTSERV